MRKACLFRRRSAVSGKVLTVHADTQSPFRWYSASCRILLSYRELTPPVVLSTGDNQPLSMIVWSFVQTGAYGQASAAAIIMIALMAPILILYWMVARRTGIVPTN
jgi:ABC-type Fe3+ transport system permease subunit